MIISKKNIELFALLDKLYEQKEEMDYYATRNKSNRLDKIENAAIEIEKVSKEIQKQVNSMRRNNRP